LPNFNLFGSYVVDCVPITSERTKISSEFIFVQCGHLLHKKKNRKYKSVTYRGFHGNANTNKTLENPRVKRKVEFWQNNRKNADDEIPPNILLVGQDSTSRMNFRRHMNKTLEILHSLGAIEMKGHTKGWLFN
jgi:hypothetical protein